MSKDMLWLHAIAYMSLSHMLLHDGNQHTTWSYIMGIAGLFATIVSGMYIIRWLWPGSEVEE